MELKKTLSPDLENRIYSKIEDWITDIVAKTQVESYIEKSFYQEFRARMVFDPIIIYPNLLLYVDILPQAEIGAYRVDFLISCTLPREKDIVKNYIVECDGVYHSTPEKMETEAERDRTLGNVGRVIHFTGKELKKDCQKCVKEVFEIIGKDFKHIVCNL